METKSYEVPAERVERLKFEVEKFVKRMVTTAKRKGVQFTPPTLTIHPEAIVKVGHKNAITGVKEPDRIYFKVDLAAEVAKVPGYTFVATLEHVDDIGTIVRTVPTVELGERELVAYRQSKPQCHHCGYTRYRKDTFVVREDATGKLIQVGRNCLKDFLGHDPQWAVQLALYACELGAMLSEDGGYFGGGQTYFSLGEYLPWVASCIRVDGWTSRTKARELEGVQPTADSALSFAFPSSDDERSPSFRRLREQREPNESDVELATKAVEFVHEKFQDADPTNLSDYEHNLSIVIMSGAVDLRKAGIAASLITYFRRDLAKREETQKDADSNYFGTVGKREEFTLTLKKIFYTETQYGRLTIYKFKDATGNIATWFSSANLAKELEIGAIYRVKATVKKHEEYRGSKQTVLSRAKVLETIKAAESGEAA